MRRTPSLSLSLLSFPLSVFAQLPAPQILHGDTLVQQVAAYIELDTAAADGSTVWDVSSTVAQNEVTAVVSTAALNPFGKTFAFADWALESDGVETFWSFSDSYTYHGGVQNGIVVYYDDPEVLYPYPFNELGWWDAFHAEYQAGGETYLRGGWAESDYAGMGTLQLPGGESVPVHQIHTIEHIVDTLPSGWIYEILSVSSQLMDGQIFVPHWASVSIEETLYDGGGEILDAASVDYGIYLADYVMDVAEPSGLGSGTVAVMPNPANAGESVKLVWHDVNHGPSEVRLFDGAGREVMRERIWPGSRATSLALPAHMTPGFYTLRFIGAEIAPQTIVIH
jgi:hypothetical protein